MGSRAMEGDWDASGAKTTKPAKTGTALPAACSSGEAFLMTGAAGGQNLYLCKPDNAWTLASGGAMSISITDMAPVAADSGLIAVVDPSAPIHPTRLYCAVQGGANVVINPDKRSEGTIGAESGRHSLGSDLTATTSGANTTTFLNAGKTDQARVSTSIRSADWIKTEYNNRNTPGAIGAAAFRTFGARTALAIARRRTVMVQ
jgi:hypothetical protein